MRVDDVADAAIKHFDIEPMREWLNGNHEEEDLADTVRTYTTGHSPGGRGFNLLHLCVMSTPKHYGMGPYHTSIDIIQRLIALGANVHESDSRFGLAPLHLCMRVENVGALLDAGADINATDRDGLTPLIIHARGGDCRQDIVRLLVRRGADISLADNDGRDAMMNAHGWGTRSFLTDVVAAGSWKAYLRAPRIELVRLRSLCARGRAPSSDSFLQRLFGTPGSSARSTRAAKRTSNPLPNEVFWHVLTYWCTHRDLL